MTPWGWVLLSVSWGILTAVTVWCFVKIFTAPFTPEEPLAHTVPHTRPNADETADSQGVASPYGHPLMDAKRTASVMPMLKAGMLYFMLVFGAGFVLGLIRILYLVPRFGTRTAELMEMPMMLAVVMFAARWVVRWFALPTTPSKRLGAGVVALGLLLIAELTLVLWLRGLPIGEYLTNRDPVAGAAYLVILGIFAIMPLLVARR